MNVKNVYKGATLIRKMQLQNALHVEVLNL